MSDKKELISYHDWQRLLESDMTISTICDKINQLYSEAIASYEAMLELTSQSVEDSEKPYTEKELKERAKEAWDEAVWKWSNPDKETDSWFDEWYNNKYSSDEAK